jgi:hypothetical protein
MVFLQRQVVKQRKSFAGAENHKTACRNKSEGFIVCAEWKNLAELAAPNC